MANFSPPQRTDWSFAEGVRREDNRFWGYFGSQPRGRSVLKIDGTWTTVDYPTADQINAATTIINTNGQAVPGAFLGGHITPITETVRLELVAAGYEDYIT